MLWLTQVRYYVLVALGVLGLALAACSSPASVADTGRGVAPQLEPTSTVNLDEHRVTSSVEPAGFLTINVDMADGSIQPASIFIPAGQRVLLVMRNRGNYEHHFHISGLVPQDMLWFSKETGDMETDGMGAAEHSEHHSGQMVSYHKCSPGAVICPTGNAVHAHAGAGGMDAIFFTATNTGTFLAADPLYPEMTANVTVF